MRVAVVGVFNIGVLERQQNRLSDIRTTSFRKVAAFLCVVAAATTALVVLTDWAIFRMMEKAGTFPDEPGVLVMQCLIAAAPYIVFAILARARARHEGGNAQPLRKAAITGFFINAAMYALIWHDAWQAHRSSVANGANIGLGISAMAAPIVVSIILARANHETKTV